MTLVSENRAGADKLGGNISVSDTLTNQDTTPLAQQTPPSVDAVSIASSAMLVELNISIWTGRKLDKRASAEVTHDNQAESGTANVHKKLLGNNPELTQIQKFAGNARNNIHYGMTMPWSDTGLRLLPTAQYMAYHKAMTAIEQDFTTQVNTFLAGYQDAVEQAHAKLGELFNPNDYPSTDEISNKFRFRFSYIPLPDAGDFRLDIANEGLEEVKAEYASYYTEQLTNAMNDVWQRAFKALTRMSERLDYADHETKKIFRDTLVDNVTDIIDLLEVCNVTGDSQMSALRLTLDDTLRGVTPDALREDATLRREVKKSVDDVIANLPSLEI